MCKYAVQKKKLTSLPTENEEAFVMHNAGFTSSFQLDLGSRRKFSMPQFAAKKLRLFPIQSHCSSRNRVQTPDEIMDFLGRLV